MKFKVGDKVRIRKDLKEGDNFEIYVDNEMEKLAGEIVTITNVNKVFAGVRYVIDKDDRFFSWTEDMFESLTKPTKEELFKMPIGTIIKTDQEENNVFVKVGEDDFCNDCADHIEEYDVNDDLTLNMFATKIVEIQEPTFETIYRADEEIKEMTMLEIEKELGYPIKIIKEE